MQKMKVINYKKGNRSTNSDRLPFLICRKTNMRKDIKSIILFKDNINGTDYDKFHGKNEVYIENTTMYVD